MILTMLFNFKMTKIKKILKNLYIFFFFCIFLIMHFFLLDSLPDRTVYAEWKIDDPHRGHVGWYGYEVKEKEKKKEKKKEHKKEKSLSIVVEKKEKWPSAEELYHMKPSQIKKWVNKASEEAIGNPTEENVKRWIEYMNVVERKASEFAGMWAWVIQTNPDLYKEAALYPSVEPGNRALWKRIWRSIGEVLKTRSNDYALLFFYRNNDPYSESMDFILKSFKENHPEWQIKKIDVNQYPYLAEKFNITYVPQIWLLPRKTRKAIPLTAGPVSVLVLEKKIYHTIMVVEGKLPPQLMPYYPWKVDKKFLSEIKKK